MQPAIILLVFINDCKAFAYLQSPVLSPIQNNCVKETKKKKGNSLPAVMSQGQMFFHVPPVSSKCCGFITSDTRLKASSWLSLPLLFHHPQQQRVWISHKIQNDMGHVN